MAAYRRVILKLSGETLAPEGSASGFDPVRVDKVAGTVWALAQKGVQLGVIMGGGNIWRGRFAERMNPVNADSMGMLATIINALMVKDAIVRLGGKAEVLTAQDMPRFARLYTRDAALEILQSGAVALLAGGTGNPFFTTDTAAALRAAELNADAVFKGTNVEGVYDGDPRKNPNCRVIPDLTYRRALDERLCVMDMTAYLLCMERGVPEIRVFNMDDLDNILRVADGEKLGTVVHA